MPGRGPYSTVPSGAKRVYGHIWVQTIIFGPYIVRIWSTYGAYMAHIQGGQGPEGKYSRACRGTWGEDFGTAHYGSETNPKGASRIWILRRECRPTNQLAWHQQRLPGVQQVGCGIKTTADRLKTSRGWSSKIWVSLSTREPFLDFDCTWKAFGNLYATYMETIRKSICYI